MSVSLWLPDNLSVSPDEVNEHVPVRCLLADDFDGIERWSESFRLEDIRTGQHSVALLPLFPAGNSGELNSAAALQLTHLP